MKYLLSAFSIALLTITNAGAQQTKKIHFMMVSIHSGVGAYHPEMIVTKEDGTQEITKADKKSWMWTGVTFDTRDGKIAANEDSLFLTLKPYFEAGWQLASSTIIKNNAEDDYIARFYFTKKDE
jgi:hypothetical protein